MAAFSEDNLVKKLGDLNNSQQSIQTLSLWLIHHRKHSKAITEIWIRELKKGERYCKISVKSIIITALTGHIFVISRRAFLHYCLFSLFFSVMIRGNHLSVNSSEGGVIVTFSDSWL